MRSAWGQVEACRIQALEDHLRVILPASEADVDDYELLDAPINETGVDFAELFVEKLQILADTLGRAGGTLRGIDNCCHGLVVSTPQTQLVAPVAFAMGVAQVIVFKLKTSGQSVVIDWMFRRRLFSRHPVSERCQQKRNGREPLLTVDQEPARDLSCALLRRYIRRPSRQNAPSCWRSSQRAQCPSTIAGSVSCPSCSPAGTRAR